MAAVPVHGNISHQLPPAADMAMAGLIPPAPLPPPAAPALGGAPLPAAVPAPGPGPMHPAHRRAAQVGINAAHLTQNTVSKVATGIPGIPALMDRSEMVTGNVMELLRLKGGSII